MKITTFWSEEDKKQIIRDYESGNFIIPKLAEIWGSSIGRVSRLLKNNSVALTRAPYKRKYTLNENYFDEIDSEEKAYFLGWLFTDGSNFTPYHAVSLTLQERDKEILDRFSKWVETDAPYYFGKAKKESHQNSLRMQMTSKKMSDRLVELGMVKNKTFKIIWPEWLNENFYKAFLRGSFEGDGSFSSKRVCIVGTEAFCNKIKEIVDSRFGFSTRVSLPRKDQPNNIRRFSFTGLNNIKRFLTWIYEDAKFYLSRKYNIYLSIKDLEHKTLENDDGTPFSEEQRRQRRREIDRRKYLKNKEKINKKRKERWRLYKK